MGEPSIDEAVDPDEAFSVLSDENRVAILRTLWESTDGPVSFSDLHAAVDVADSGQFNYHLGKLTDQFVQKTDDGYQLTAAGIRVVGAIVGGAYTMTGTAEPVELDEPCPSCGDRWQFSYENEFARFECDSCPIVIMYPVPPATFVGAAPEEMPQRTERYLRALLEQLRNEICPYCDGRIEPRAVLRTPPEASSEETVVPLVEYDCERCSGDLVTDLASPLVTHPAVSSFYYERGIDVREPPIWHFTEFDDRHTTVENEEPLRLSVTYQASGDELTVTVDESLEICEIGKP